MDFSSNSSVLRRIQRELNALGDSKRKTGITAFFTETVRTRGIKTPVLRALARRWEVKLKKAGWSNDDFERFGLALLKVDWLDECAVANELLKRLSKRGYFDENPEKSWRVFESWLPCYSNWAIVDIHCGSIVGPFLEKHPEYLPRLKKWAANKSRWYKRASTVALVAPAYHGKYLNECYARAEYAMSHGDDLLNKAAWWVLRNAGGKPGDKDYSKRQARLYAFLFKRIRTIPRVTLSYATEKMNKKQRAVLYAMER